MKGASIQNNPSKGGQTCGMDSRMTGVLCRCGFVDRSVANEKEVVKAEAGEAHQERRQVPKKDDEVRWCNRQCVDRRALVLVGVPVCSDLFRSVPDTSAADSVLLMWSPAETANRTKLD